MKKIRKDLIKGNKVTIYNRSRDDKASFLEIDEFSKLIRSELEKFKVEDIPKAYEMLIAIVMRYLKS